jgi:phage shock protein A
VAEPKRNDLLGRLAELSEEAVQRLQEAPGGDRVIGTMNAMRDRVDELQKRVRGIDELERRLSALERKVEKLSKDSSSAPARSTKPKS